MSRLREKEQPYLNLQKERYTNRGTHSAATADSFFAFYKSIEEGMLHFHK
jgi:hypothetical protein